MNLRSKARHAAWLLGSLVAGVALCASCAPSPTLRLTFIGNAAFELSDGRNSLLVDFPYVSGAGGLMTFDSGAVRPKGAVLALFTHRHADHFDRDALLSRGWPAWGPAEVLAQLPPDKVFARTDSIAFGAFQVVRIPEPHGEVEHVAFLITWHGRRIYHSGDSMDQAALEALPELDVALVQENLLCWISGQRGGRIPARELVVFHHFSTGSRGCLGARELRQGESIVLHPK